MTEQNVPETPEVDITDEDLRATEEVVASTVLKSDKGWEILRQLYLEGAKKLLTTQGFTFPVLKNMAILEDKLSDPIGFKKSFDTLLQDLQQYKADLDKIQAKHAGKSGKPTEAEWPIMFALSQEYSDLMHRFDTVVAPLIFSLVETIQKEHGDLLESAPQQPAQ